MNYYAFPVAAAVACAACNGAAAVLQKIGADKEKNVTNLDAGLLWRLFQNKPYAIGVGLDIVGWGLTLFAVQYLPLFLVEAIIAGNIVITALIERFVRGRKLSRTGYAAIGVILIGLIMLALAASPEQAEPVSNILRWSIIASPILLGVVGFFLARGKSRLSTTGLAIVAGLCFGDTSVIGRIFNFSHPLWHTLYSPFIPALIVSGTLGILLFSTALQRAQATVMNATMTASQTLIPAIVGIVYLGDQARNGLWYLVVVGSLLALTGVITLATRS